MGFLYLLCFERGLSGGLNRHYLGYSAADPERRIRAHKRGRGSAFAREAKRQGIRFVVAGIWPDMTTADERRIKRQKHHRRFCVACLRDQARPFPPDASQCSVAGRTASETAETSLQASGASGAAYGPPVIADHAWRFETERYDQSGDPFCDEPGCVLTIAQHPATYGPPDDDLSFAIDDDAMRAAYGGAEGWREATEIPYEDEPPDRPDQSDEPMWHELADDERYPGVDLDGGGY